MRWTLPSGNLTGKLNKPLMPLNTATGSWREPHERLGRDLSVVGNRIGYQSITNYSVKARLKLKPSTVCEIKEAL